MRMYDIIMKKRNGCELTREEINYFVKGYTSGEIPDYQASALLMAVFFQKMNYNETLELTLAMAKSGDMLDLSGISGIKADKHSTGGVGDKVSLVLAPLMASCGIKMAKMSGRGLGHTGGTIDKLESFKGFNTSLSEEEFLADIEKTGFAITGQTGNLAPADKKLYALRDVTATVDNISLIASSIMSKKLAAGADIIVLDVKSGSGAFMKNDADAFKLAKAMVDIGNGAGRKTAAVISDMDQPLGYAVGNALEVQEAIKTLKGEGPGDLKQLCFGLGTEILKLSGKVSDSEEAVRMLEDAIASGAALKKFAEFIEAQQGNADDVYNPAALVNACIVEDIVSDKEGYVSHIDSESVGIASMLLGGGRKTKNSVIDLSVGFILNKKKGDYVKKGEKIAVLYANDGSKVSEAKEKFLNAYTFSSEIPSVNKIIKGIIA